MNFKMQGLYTAIITPLDAQDSVCEKSLVSLLHTQAQSGVDAVVVLGTTGEAATMDDNEREAIISTAVRELKGKTIVMAGCGSPSTHKAVEMAKRAQDLGVDALQVVTPYYNRPTQEGIYLHFEAVSRAVDLPICIYNIPSRCGQNIELSTVLKLAELPNVVGIKECSGSFQQIGDIVEQVCHKRSGFSLFSGDDPITVPMMALGAHGVMSVLSNLVPRAVKQLVKAMLEGNIALARATHYALRPLMQVLFIESNPSPIKYLMHLANIDSGRVRLPLCQVTKASQEKLQKAFEASKHIIDEELYQEVMA